MKSLRRYILSAVIIVSCTAITYKKDSRAVSSDLNYRRLSKFQGDTAAYLRHNFVKHAYKYRGSSFLRLLNDIEIPIKSYSILLGPVKGAQMSTGIALSFYSAPKTGIYHESIFVEWRVPVYRKTVSDMNTKSQSNWTQKEVDFFKDREVKQVFLNLKS